MLSSQAQVAKLCRQYLKGIGIQASCTSESFAGGDAVTVTFHDANPTLDRQINDELSKYQYGSFDGMTDSYDYTNTRDDIPQTKYLHVNNRFSEELKQKAWDFIRANISEAVNMTPIYSYEELSQQRIGGQPVDMFMFRFLNTGSINDDLAKEFWASLSTPKAAPKPKPTPTPNKAPESITVSEGKREGFVEIRFPAKPSADERTELKQAGFRWSPRNTCWWGKADKLPASYK